MWREILKALKKCFGFEEGGCRISNIMFFERLYCYKSLKIDGSMYVFDRLEVV